MTEFPPQLPHGELEEILPSIFFVAGQSRPDFGGKTFQFSRNMVVIKDGDALTLVNTLRLDAASLARLETLGSVTNIVRLGAFHGRDDAFYIDRYSAPFWALPGMDFQRGETVDKVLTPGQPGPCSDATVFVYETSAMPEAILRLDRQGGVVIACDSLQNWTGPDSHFDEASAEMMAAQGFFPPANVGPGWRAAAQPEPSDFARLNELEFQHLLSAHGDPLLNDAQSAVAATLNELFGV
jgi:hypothetical protein